MSTTSNTATRRRTAPKKQATRRTAPRKPEPVKITQVNKSVLATAMEAAGGDASRIRIISATKVVVTS